MSPHGEDHGEQADSLIPAPHGDGPRIADRPDRGNGHGHDGRGWRHKDLESPGDPQPVSSSAFGIELSGCWRPARAALRTGSASSRIALTCTSSSAEVPGPSSGWAVQAGESVHIGWGGYADYRISGEPAPNTHWIRADISEEEAGIAFFFSVLPLALPLFDLEPLHGSAVETSDGPVVLLGPSGCGKSSVAAALDSLGFPLLTDDVAAMDARLRLWPGLPLVNPRWSAAVQPIVYTYNGKPVRAAGIGRKEEPAVPSAVVLLRASNVREPILTETGPHEGLRGVLGNSRHGWFMKERRHSLQLTVAAGLAERRVISAVWDPVQSPETLAEILLRKL
jgi:hypothetical protein